MCNISYPGDEGRRISSSRSTQAVSETLSQKQKYKPKDCSITPVVECLLSMHEAMGSVPSNTHTHTHTHTRGSQELGFVLSRGPHNGNQASPTPYPCSTASPSPAMSSRAVQSVAVRIQKTCLSQAALKL
jgi:hypothetical protein